jgi:hypothetical protein
VITEETITFMPKLDVKVRWIFCRNPNRVTVLSGPHLIPSGGHFYDVTIDKAGLTGTGIIINASEIEIDAAAFVGG